MAAATPPECAAPTVAMHLETGPPEACDVPDLQSVSNVVRAFVAELGLPVSDGTDRPGFVLCAEGSDEFSVTYIEPSRHAGAMSAEPAPREAADALFRCCGALVRSGFSVTLVASPRTLALYVRPV